ncbi:MULTISPECIES: cyclopropane fatty acyl phospholipid synthase [Legionella]|uniref:Cyclopropane fatty acyl phospholipid synthase n=1 Tax=Legionella steelei TaxID=947033 RepID=A0A0W0ZK05_9GAMM|nr:MULTISPECIES: cyclopropane fatty acyl phospholipid synthase [Legionella]KTD69415.1 cyclopropane fatty acyl phospholipid synthase [Legionella steelei]MBN9229030.1 cyclopropane fatty acyl phospholipid synthase [Legionella steelei]OJW06432.1 MAG: cyclopropane-fatty-acyl-phospholipid synthase [Legionella sp. 39-23]
MNQQIKKIAIDLLHSAGIMPNGNEAWDIQVNNEEFYSRIFNEGSLALGETYMDGWWDCKSLDQFFARILRAQLDQKVKADKWLWPKLIWLKLINHQSKKRALEVGRTHYDLGNELFKSMLDSRMNYTCGYWKNANDLDTAQLNKLELSCQKLKFEAGMRVLDIGCGFGAFAKYAVENYGVNVVGVTISKEQYEYAKQNCAGLPIEIRLQDYRDIHEQFDRVVSLGMFEHVGYRNYRVYMQKVRECLKDDGLFLLHTIGGNQTTKTVDPWINKYIFPNGMIPSMEQISTASNGLFIMENWANFGAYYDKTLMAWHERFEENWDHLKEQYDQRFYRMWRYYLLACAGSFRARSNQLWQIVFSKEGILGGYQEPLFTGIKKREPGNKKTVRNLELS